VTPVPPLPDALRRRIAADLAPVRPLPPPVVRTLWLTPVALLLLFGSVLAFGLRRDAPTIGGLMTWGASAVEMALGLGLAGAALRDAVPGTSLTRRVIGAIILAAVLLVVLTTWVTWELSATRLAPAHVFAVWRICFGATLLTALPPLTLAGWLVARALPLRPRLGGALCGLGAGLMADAGWRLFCHYSDPAHVVSAHLAAVAVVALVGAAASVAGGWRSARGTPRPAGGVR
jgi:hypothetical protein